MNIDEMKLKADERAIFALRALYGQYGYSQFKMSKFEEYDLYSKNKDFIAEDAVVILNGEVIQDDDIFSDELVYKLNLQSVKPIKKKRKYICIKMKDITEWEEIKETIKPYRVKDETGYSLVVYDEMYKQYRRTTFWVSPEICCLKSLSPVIAP